MGKGQKVTHLPPRELVVRTQLPGRIHLNVPRGAADSAPRPDRPRPPQNPRRRHVGGRVRCGRAGATGFADIEDPCAMRSNTVNNLIFMIKILNTKPNKK